MAGRAPQSIGLTSGSARVPGECGAHAGHTTRWASVCIATSASLLDSWRDPRTACFVSPKLTLKMRPLVRSWPFTSLWWHWFLSYQSIMKTLPSGPYLRLMICDQGSLASRKSGACEPTNPEPLRLEDIAIDPGPVDVVHEERAAVLGRPGAAQVDHRAGVGMAAAGGVGPAVAAMRVGAEVMPVIGDGLDVVVGVGIEMLARLPLVPASLDHVVEVGDDAGGDEHLAAGVEVDAPGVAGAVGEDLEGVPGRVIAPDAGVDRECVRQSGVPGLPTREWVKTPWQP